MAPKSSKGSRKLDDFFVKKAPASVQSSTQETDVEVVTSKSKITNGDGKSEVEVPGGSGILADSSQEPVDTTYSLFGVSAEHNGVLLRALEEDDPEPLVSVLCEERKRMPQSSAPSSNRKANKKSKGAKDVNDPFSILQRRVLHYACACDAVECSGLLLKGGSFPAVSIDDSDDDGRTALHHAAHNHSLRCIELLLLRGASLSRKSKQGRTPLEESLRSPKLELRVREDSTAASIVSRVRELDLSVPRVLEPRSKDFLLPIAFAFASEGNIVSLLALLAITRGSIANAVVKGSGVQGVNEEGGTLVDVFLNRALSFSSEGHRSRHGEDHDGWSESSTNASGSEEEQAARKQALLFLEAILQFNPRLSHHQQSTLACPIIRAAKRGDAAVVGLLLDHGANANEADAEGNTALHWVLRQPSTPTRTAVVARIVRRLLEAGSHVTTGNKQGATPVHTAAGHGHTEALRLLLDKDASGTNMLAATKETPLHYAVKNNHLGCTAILLRKGANRNVTSVRSAKPAQLATTEEMKALLDEDSSTLAAKTFDFELMEYHAPQSQSQSAAPRPPQQMRVLQQQLEEVGAYGWQQSQDLWDAQLALQHGGDSASGLGSAAFYGMNTNSNSNNNASFEVVKAKSSLRAKERPSASAPSSDNNPAFKTKLCISYEKRRACPHGSKCLFAHGPSELRTPATNAVAAAAAAAAVKAVRPTLGAHGSNGHDQAVGPDDFCSRKIFVGGLPHYATAEDMWEVFESNFGKVADTVVIEQASVDGSSHSRGFGFVLFESQASADCAVAKQWVNFRGRKVEVKHAVARQGIAGVMDEMGARPGPGAGAAAAAKHGPKATVAAKPPVAAPWLPPPGAPPPTLFGGALQQLTGVTHPPQPQQPPPLPPPPPPALDFGSLSGSSSSTPPFGSQQPNSVGLYNNGVQMPPPAAWTLPSHDSANAQVTHGVSNGYLAASAGQSYGAAAAAGYQEELQHASGFGALHMGYTNETAASATTAAPGYAYAAPPADRRGPPPTIHHTSAIRHPQAQVTSNQQDDTVDDSELSELLAMLTTDPAPLAPQARRILSNQMASYQSQYTNSMSMPGYPFMPNIQQDQMYRHW